MTLRRAYTILAILLCGGVVFFTTSPAFALPENQIRRLVKEARDLEKNGQWDEARVIYEHLLGQPDHGLRIRERYHEALRRCWQTYRHQDTSYRKEVLTVEFSQALRIYSVVSNTLLHSSLDKKKIDSARLFRKGLDELDAALADPQFIREHIPSNRHGEVAAFRAMMRKTWGSANQLTHDEAADQIARVALAAEVALDLSATVVVMEFACGACYAIDEYTVYLTPNQLRELAQSLSRTEVIGVGITLTIHDNRIVVHEVAMEGPASGILERGDHIVSINKKAVADYPYKDVVEMLKGPSGSMVEIQFMSAQDMMLRTIGIPRRAAAASVNAFPWPGTRLGYLQINSFTETTAQDVDAAINALNKEGMKGLILDLRANGGGVFDSSIETARKFLATGIIASTQHQDPKLSHIYQAKNPNALTLPLAVLVDGDTASAAEVLAGALKDNDRATLIGQTTYGKGCTQCLLKLPGATGNVPTGGLKVTVARVFSPKGLPYSARGVVPHIFIDENMAESESSLTGRDAYINRAIEELHRVLLSPK